MGNIGSYLAVAAIALVVTMATNRPARLVALKVGYTAQPDERKVHQRVEDRVRGLHRGGRDAGGIPHCSIAPPVAAGG